MLGTEQRQQCPDCEGQLQRVGIFPIYAEWVPKEERSPIITFPCDYCNGTGTVTQEQLEWRRIGREMKQERLGRGYGLRSEAERRNMLPSELSKMERGICKPERSAVR